MNSLYYQKRLSRNIGDKFFTYLSVICALIAILPLIFTALFSYYYITGFGDLFYEMGSLAVLIYNFALEPYDAQNKLAWAASFILVLSILSVNIFSRILSAFTEKTKRV